MTVIRGVQLVRSLPVMKTGSVVIRPVTTSLVRYDEGYVSQNRKLGRPLSPSLKLLFANPDPVWIFSIGHRVSGCILTPTVSILSIAYIAHGGQFNEFVKILQPLYQSPALWTSIKFLFAFPFAYHSFIGIRHLWVSGIFRGVLYGARRGVMTGKRGNKNFYKGRGARGIGRHTRKGGFIINQHLIPEIVVPDLEGFELKPYVSFKTPQIKVQPLTAKDILEVVEPEMTSKQ